MVLELRDLTPESEFRNAGWAVAILSNNHFCDARALGVRTVVVLSIKDQYYNREAPFELDLELEVAVKSRVLLLSTVVTTVRYYCQVQRLGHAEKAPNESRLAFRSFRRRAGRRASMEPRMVPVAPG